MMRIRSGILGGAVLVVLLTAGAAQSLAGTNTVFSDDIVDGTIRHADVKPNSLGGSRLLDNAVTGGKISDGSVTGADLADDSVGRSEVDFSALSDVERVLTAYTIAPNTVAEVSALCPDTKPVVLGGGFSWLNGSGMHQPGFALRVNGPLTNLDGWQVIGQNALPQAQNLIVHAVCASDGSSE